MKTPPEDAALDPGLGTGQAMLSYTHKNEHIGMWVWPEVRGLAFLS